MARGENEPKDSPRLTDALPPLAQGDSAEPESYEAYEDDDEDDDDVVDYEPDPELLRRIEKMQNTRH